MNRITHVAPRQITTSESFRPRLLAILAAVIQCCVAQTIAICQKVARAKLGNSSHAAYAARVAAGGRE